MNISPIKTSPSFGTNIVIQDRAEQQQEMQKTFPKYLRSQFQESMCDFWTSVNEKPSNYKIKGLHRPRKPVQISTSDQRYLYKKAIFGETRCIDICSGGIVVGNDGKIGMFHIAPTLDNYDNLCNSAYIKTDRFGKSIDDFAKKTGGIKKAIIVGGKEPHDTRESYSKIINKAIRERFEVRDIPTTVLSDFKKSECDLFYSGATDTLKIGVMGLTNGEKAKDVFGELKLEKGDSIVI